jgi:hypothetical protein
MNEYLDDLDYLLVHHQLLKVSVIYVLQFPVVYHEVHVEKPEQLELDLILDRKNNSLKKQTCNYSL